MYYKFIFQIEQIKRLNKLWSNDAILIKDCLLIPCPTNTISSSSESYVEGNIDGCNSESSSTCSKVNEIDAEKSDRESGHDGNCESEEIKSYNNIFSKIDGQIKTYKDSIQDKLKSDAYKSFNEMLAKIDDQIQDHRNK